VLVQAQAPELALVHRRPDTGAASAPSRPPPQPRPLVIEPSSTRWRDLVPCVGIVAGAGMFAAALTLRLNDAALPLAVALLVRVVRMMFDGARWVSWPPRP
jgi:hypothetical protein